MSHETMPVLCFVCIQALAIRMQRMQIWKKNVFMWHSLPFWSSYEMMRFSVRLFWGSRTQVGSSWVYVLRSSRITRKSGALIVRYNQKKEWISLVFYCFENPSIARNFGTTGPIWTKFSAKCTRTNGHFNQIGNWKVTIFDIRLISLDRITFCW